MYFRSKFWLTGCALLLVIPFSSCSRDPQVRKLKYFESGQRYFEKGQYPEAAIQFTNAIKVDPNYTEAHHQLAESYIRLQKPQGAFQELGRVLQLQPGNHETRIELANLLILGRNLSEAKDQVELLLKQRPDDPAVHSLNSSLLAAQGKVADGIAEMQKTVALDPGHWQFYLGLAILQTQDHQLRAAEESLRKVIELDPSSGQARILLGNAFQSEGRYTEAERQFLDAINVAPKSPESRAALVRLYLTQGKRTEAEQVATRAKQEFPNDPSGYRLLASLYFLTGDIQKSLAEYSLLTQEHPSDLEVKKDYIQLLLQKGQFSEARRLDDVILRANPNDNDALVYRSQMQISDGHANDAAAALESLIKKDPANAEAHFVLGVAEQKLGNPERAESEWRESLRHRPDLLDSVRALAGVALGRVDMDSLDQQASEIIRLQPASPEGYALRALSNVNRKRFSIAEADIQKAIAIAPQSSYGFVELGNLKLAENQFGAAATAYQSALDRNADSKDALRGLMNAYVAQKKGDQAISAAKSQIAKSPNNSGFYDLLGTILYSNKKDLAAAATALEKSAQLDQNNVDAEFKLAQVQAAKGSTDDAIRTCRRALDNNPNEPAFYVLMGELFQSRQDWNHATDAYQKALAIKPEHPLASNDLAAVMLQTGGNLDMALSLAQTARRGMPASPAVADNLGWIYYQKGAYRSAVDTLQEALRLSHESNATDNPRLHYHLGMAYAKSGKATLAKQQLQETLRIDPHSSDADDARKELAQLRL